MTKPSAIHAIKRYQFSTGRENIRSRQVRMPRIGTKGYSGTRKGRSASGFVARIVKTAPTKMKKAKRVPILVRGSNASIGRKPVNKATNTPTRIVDRQGVRNF